MESGPRRSLTLQLPLRSQKLQNAATIACTAKTAVRYSGLRGKLRTYLEKISLNLEEEKELEKQLRIETNIRMNFNINEELCACSGHLNM